MVKKGKQSDGKSRVRVFAFEFEGDDETLQEGFHAIAAAINKTFETKTVVKRIISSGSNDQEQAVEEELDENDVFDIDEEETVSRSQRKSNSKRSPPKMKIVPELDLHQPGVQSFNDFYERHKHETQHEQITLSVFYLEQILNLEKIDSNHVYTCLEEVNEKCPNDLPQVMRNCVSKKKMDSKGRKARNIQDDNAGN